MEQTKFFSIHNLELLEGKKEFSVIVGNVENTPEKLDLAKSLYPSDHWYIEFHDCKRSMCWVN